MTILKPKTYKLHCPTCDKITLMRYDAFEDMYRCYECEIFYYPENVTRKSNPNAGYLNND